MCCAIEAAAALESRGPLVTAAPAQGRAPYLTTAIDDHSRDHAEPEHDREGAIGIIANQAIGSARTCQGSLPDLLGAGFEPLQRRHQFLARSFSDGGAGGSNELLGVFD